MLHLQMWCMSLTGLCVFAICLLGLCVFLYLCPFRLAGDIIVLTGLFVHLRPAYPSIHLSSTEFVNKICWQRMDLIYSKLTKVIHGAREWNGQLLGLVDQMSKSQAADIGATYEWSISKTNEPILLQIGRSGLWGKELKNDQLLGSSSHDAKAIFRDLVAASFSTFG